MDESTSRKPFGLLACHASDRVVDSIAAADPPRRRNLNSSYQPCISPCCETEVLCRYLADGLANHQRRSGFTNVEKPGLSHVNLDFQPLQRSNTP
jgi:hypothetical protein